MTDSARLFVHRIGDPAAPDTMVAIAARLLTLREPQTHIADVGRYTCVPRNPGHFCDSR